MVRLGGGGGGGGGGDGGAEGEGGKQPGWLSGLMREERFFGGCVTHFDRRKNEMNIYCLFCCLPFCPHCLPSHSSHPLLQVRRYVYHDVVRLDDLQKLIDCSFIQAYTINGAKVIFLKSRPQAQGRSCKASSSSSSTTTTSVNNNNNNNNICFTCDRVLQPSFHFCSLSCKVKYMEYEGEELSSILFKFNESDFAATQFEGLWMDSSEVEDSLRNSHNTPLDDMPCSSTAMGNSGISLADQNGAVSREKKKKKKTKGFLVCGSLGSRRKSAPHRSPLS